jgi:RNA polymerase sigma-70 factor, ECF subfamily
LRDRSGYFQYPGKGARVIEEPEHDKLEEARAGDPDAFAVLVEKYSARIYGTCFRILGNRQDAEDCAQDTFIKAFRAFREYNGLSSFYTWIYRIAVNTCLDYRRKSRKTIVYSLDEAFDTEDSQVYLQIADNAPLPDELAESAETSRLVHQEISHLPEYLRDILVLRDLEGLSYHELAQILHLSEGTVKSRLSRARSQLMNKIRQREQSAHRPRLTDKPE